ncbi:DNA repair protein RecO [Candidatus Saccharibacteria bacterium]|nr:DNA repair protein RecO [Candidatus Saccharibacteria bacterium]
MSKDTADVRTLGYVLRRTNYGEADRILNIITKQGKISAIAKGVRKSKSKLAGNIEIFSLIDFNIHQGKSELGIVTGAKMLKHHSNILKNYDHLELASTILKNISAASENSDNPDFFDITDQSLAGLNANLNSTLVEAWFYLRLAQASGEEINLYRETDGNPLSPEQSYTWDFMEKSLKPTANGNISAAEIKFLRLMSTAKLAVVAKVKNIDELLPPIFSIIKNN